MTRSSCSLRIKENCEEQPSDNILRRSGLSFPDSLHTSLQEEKTERSEKLIK